LIAGWSDLDDAKARETFGGGLHPELEEEIDAFTDDVRFWIRTWTFYQKGHLLYSGGINDQPLRWLEAMELIAGVVGRVQQDRFEKEQRKLQRSGPPRLDAVGMSGMKRTRVV